LDAKLIEKRTELRTKEQYLRPDAFEIRSIQQVIAALDSQRQQETGTLVTSGGASMAATLLAYEDVKMQAEFAQQAYASAFALVESSQLAAGRQEKFLLLIEAPNLPEDPIFPVPAIAALTAFAVSAILFGIGRLTLTTIRDHSI
jgi:capsular polysaccharide transport system permease protein